MPFWSRFWLLAALAGLGGACGQLSADATVDAAPVDAISCAPEACDPFACDPSRAACFHDCVTERECAPAHDCIDNVCVGTECSAQTAAMLCAPYACVNGRCVTDCALGSCADGYYCRGDTGQCVPHCTERGDPRCAGFLCDVPSGECEPYCLAGELGCAAGYVCTETQQCAPDSSAAPCRAGCGAYACVPDLGHCGTHCLSASDCAVSAECVDGHCL